MKKIVLAIVFSILAPAVAYAGTWVKGHGTTYEAAKNDAIQKAEAAVRAGRGKCVDYDRIRIKEKEHGLWVVEVHYSHTNGACRNR